MNLSDMLIAMFRGLDGGGPYDSTPAFDFNPLEASLFAIICNHSHSQRQCCAGEFGLSGKMRLKGWENSGRCWDVSMH